MTHSIQTEKQTEQGIFTLEKLLDSAGRTVWNWMIYFLQEVTSNLLIPLCIWVFGDRYSLGVHFKIDSTNDLIMKLYLLGKYIFPELTKLYFILDCWLTV